MSEFEWVEPRPFRFRRVQFNGNYEDLPAEVRRSPKVELTEHGWVVIHTIKGPARLDVDDYLHVPNAIDIYPVLPEVSKHRYRVVDGPFADDPDDDPADAEFEAKTEKTYGRLTRSVREDKP